MNILNIHRLAKRGSTLRAIGSTLVVPKST
jgi:hypothetical protein